ncbi:Calcineurin B homologous protein 1 [Toxocara canis]|uniref:Calcineurin B homologous protein 1 n=1 Tax=Toxocara canis TaxID=6265 RepID=A0A0B2W3W7_TOXCA|nr:Calcineurin B homologous protein 1 [Toxocara canis]
MGTANYMGTNCADANYQRRKCKEQLLCEGCSSIINVFYYKIAKFWDDLTLGSMVSDYAANVHIMGASSSSLSELEIEKLSIESGLSRKGIVTLYNRFISLAKHKDTRTDEVFMSHHDFLDIQELQMNPLGARIIDAFFADAEVGDRKRVYFRDFVKVLSHFRPINKAKPHPWNSREAKLRFAFTMYDLNKSGTITKDEFREILQMMIGGNVPVEQVNSIADRTMREADRDGDGCITFHEFCNAMEKTDIEQRMSFRFLT